MLKKKRKSHENSVNEKYQKRKEYGTNLSLINVEENISKNRIENFGEIISVSNNDNDFYQQDKILWDNEVKSSFDIDDFDFSKNYMKSLEKPIPEDPNKSSFDVNHFYLAENANQNDDNDRLDKSIESNNNQILPVSEERDINLQDLENIVTISNNLNSSIILESNAISINNDENIQERKILNVIFDLDETLVSANTQINPNLNPFQIEFNIDGRPSIQKVLVREGAVELLQHLDKFCNIFFYTNGIELYANEIIKLLSRLSK